MAIGGPWHSLMAMQPQRLLVLASFALVAPRGEAQVQRPNTMAGRSAVYAPHGVIATSQPLASAAGLAVLERGGNAIDAAVTAAAVLGLVEPMMTGPGGDVFAIVWSAKDHKLIGLNASGRAGSLMTREALIARGRTSVPHSSVEAVIVPGAVAGWQALLSRYGTLTLAQALAPAIKLADGGFPVSPVIARDWHAAAELLKKDDGARKTFFIGDHTPATGEWFSNPDYAASLRLIATQGPSAIYGGTLGQRIVDRVKALGGFLTLDDMKKEKATWVEPISVPFKGYKVWELPPNNQGVAVLEMLRMLDADDLPALGYNSPAYLHRLVEAKKLAYADLAQYVGDPDAMTVPAARLFSDDFIAQRKGQLDAATSATDRVDPGPATMRSETIYLTAADKDGNMISFINSLYDEFGSGVVVPGTGFALEDRGAGFTLQPGMANTVAPGKRPFHTLIPAFVTKDDQPYLSFGVMGGAMQAQGHVQVLLDLLVFHMGLQEAIDQPRWRHFSGKQLGLEVAFPDATRASLVSMGHELLPDSVLVGQFGGAQAIRKLARGWEAASDPRKDGEAVGY
jgi:gamma-glutamyltranspeptidase/glutathione hydrolase